MPDILHNTSESLGVALANSVITTLKAAVAERGEATLVVSGGNTPRALFNRLSGMTAPWEAVTIVLADERWVDSNSSDSNEGMVRRELLTGRAAKATLLSLIPRYPNQDQNLASVRQQLAQLPRYDLVILGMGGDLHTASLFPCAPEITEGLVTKEPVLVTHPRTAPYTRVSQSLQRLTATRRGIVHIVGERKITALNEARTSTNPAVAPISAFIPPQGSFEVWASR